MMTRVLWILAFLGGCLGWDDNGHMLVGEIARMQLNSADVQTLEALLKRWDGEFPDMSSLAAAATWPDHLKCKRRKADCSDKLPLAAVGAFSLWHDYNLPYNPYGIPLTEAQAHPPTNPSLVFLVEQANSTLFRKNVTATFSWNFFLRFMIHVVGDVHQPLHAISLYTASLPDSDYGGADIRLNKSLGGDLHQFWDLAGMQYLNYWPFSDVQKQALSDNATALIQAYPKSHFTATGRLPDVPAGQGWPADIMAWVLESYAISVNEVYSGWDLNSTRPVLSPQYVARAQELCREQITLAGYRLAQWLQLVVKRAPKSSTLANPGSVQEAEPVPRDNRDNRLAGDVAREAVLVFFANTGAGHLLGYLLTGAVTGAMGVILGFAAAGYRMRQAPKAWLPV